MSAFVANMRIIFCSKSGQQCDDEMLVITPIPSQPEMFTVKFHYRNNKNVLRIRTLILESADVESYVMRTLELLEFDYDRCLHVQFDWPIGPSQLVDPKHLHYETLSLVREHLHWFLNLKAWTTLSIPQTPPQQPQQPALDPQNHSVRQETLRIHRFFDDVNPNRQVEIRTTYVE